MGSLGKLPFYRDSEGNVYSNTLPSIFEDRGIIQKLSVIEDRLNKLEKSDLELDENYRNRATYQAIIRELKNHRDQLNQLRQIFNEEIAEPDEYSYQSGDVYIYNDLQHRLVIASRRINKVIGDYGAAMSRSPRKYKRSK